MPAYIEKFIGNKASNPWWLGLPEVVGLYDLADEDVKSQRLREELFNYTVRLQPVDVEVNGAYQEVPGHFAPICSDGYVIPAVVGSKYEIFQPQAFCDLGDAMASTGECEWHTAGILKDRTRIWGLAKFGEQFKVGPDGIQPFLLFWNTFDGSSRWIVKLVETCVVCWNTADLALKEDRKNWIALKHTGNAEEKLAEVRESLGILKEQIPEEHAFMESLLRIEFNRDQFQTLVCQMLTGLDDANEAITKVVKAKKAQKTIYEAKGEEMMNVWESGLGASEREEDGNRALQAITEFIDWQRGRMANYNREAKRFTTQGLNSAWFGDGARQKKRALRLITRGA